MNRLAQQLIVILTLTMLVIGAAGAQPPDGDGDGVPDATDLCPNQPGSARLGGCPRGDMDGDGIGNFDDQCIHQPGPVENRGCPLPEQPEQPAQPEQPQPTDIPAVPTATPAPTPIPPAPIPADGPCAVSPNGSRVNIRDYPSTQAEIVGQLLPGQLYEVGMILYIGDETWFAVPGGWVNGIAVVAGGLCGEVPRLDVPNEGLVSPDHFAANWPEEWQDIDTDQDKSTHPIAFAFPDEGGGTFLQYKLQDILVSGLTGEDDETGLKIKLTDILVTSYRNGPDGSPEFTGGYMLADLDGETGLFELLILPDPESDAPGGKAIGVMFGDGSVRLASYAGMLGSLGYIEQDNLIPYIEQDNLLPYLEQDNAAGILHLPSFELMIGRDPAGAAGGPHVKVFNGITDGTSNTVFNSITDGTSNTFFDIFVDPPDPDSYTREHVLLARQVGVPAAADGSVKPGDGSVVPGDGSVVPGDGSVVPGDGSVMPAGLVLSIGVGDPTGMGLLLPAVQKVREAAAR